MKIVVQFDDLDLVNSIQNKINEKINTNVIDGINAYLARYDFEKLIADKIDKHIAKSIDKTNLLTERTVRNFLQQKIARELASTVFKK